jgi:hypothetical protein
MLDKAISEIYEKFPYFTSVKYSGRFKPYRANVKLNGDRIQFNLSKKWKRISPDIQIGLIQELLLKLMKNKLKPLKTNTQSIELYNFFLQKIHIAVPKTDIDPILEESFDRVNGKYFLGTIDKTNLIWGSNSVSKLGSYEYGADTIMISRVLEGEEELLDYVMYHEMLHKKHKFKKRGSRSYHHTSKFKRDEREFENSEFLEKRLRQLLARRRHSFKRVIEGLF